MNDSTPTGAQIASESRVSLWTGYVVSAIPVLMLFMSGIMKWVKPTFVVEGFTHLGWPEQDALTLGILEMTCVIVYVIPRTSMLGAILMTGYLGGAIATHVRIGETMVLPQIGLGVLVWLGLYLRDRRVRALIPLQRH